MRDGIREKVKEGQCEEVSFGRRGVLGVAHQLPRPQRYISEKIPERLRLHFFFLNAPVGVSPTKPS